MITVTASPLMTGLLERADGDTVGAWLELDFGKQVEFDEVVLREAGEGKWAVTGHKVQYWNGSAWIDLAAGAAIEWYNDYVFSPVTPVRSDFCVPVSVRGDR